MKEITFESLKERLDQLKNQLAQRTHERNTAIANMTAVQGAIQEIERQLKEMAMGDEQQAGTDGDAPSNEVKLPQKPLNEATVDTPPAADAEPKETSETK